MAAAEGSSIHFLRATA